MQTSNFSKSAGDPRAVAITRGIPQWFKGRAYQKLAPLGWMLKIEDRDEFERLLYEKVLGRLDAREVFRELGEDAILLCYEGPTQWCHRHMVKEWLEKELGIVIPEVPERVKVEPATAPIRKRTMQGGLFE